MRERLARVNTDWPDHLPVGNQAWEWDEERNRFVPRRSVVPTVKLEQLPAPERGQRCRGKLILEDDRWGRYLLCLDCGNHIELVRPLETQSMREPTLIGA